MDKFESLCLLINVALRSRGSAVAIVSGLGAGRSGVLYSGRGKKCISLPKRPERKWGHPAAIQCAPSFLSGLMWPGLEVDNSPPSSAEVKNGRNYTSTPPRCPHGGDGGNCACLTLTNGAM